MLHRWLEPRRWRKRISNLVYISLDKALASFIWEGTKRYFCLHRAYHWAQTYGCSSAIMGPVFLSALEERASGLDCCRFFFFCSSALTRTGWVRSTIKPISPVHLYWAELAVDKSRGDIKNFSFSWKRPGQESNLGRRGEKRERCLCAMPNPLKVRTFTSGHW